MNQQSKYPLVTFNTVHDKICNIEIWKHVIYACIKYYVVLQLSSA